MNLKNILLNMGILALLVFGLMAFILTTQNENNVALSITNNTLINDSFGSLSSELTSVQPQSQTALNTFQNITPNENLGVWQVTPIVNAGRTARVIIVGFWNILVKLPVVILGVSPLVSSLLNGLLIILLILGAWAWWKGVITQ